MSQRNSNLIEQALAALRCEEYARAVAIADQLAAELPDNPLVRAIRAQGLLYSDDPKAAFDEAQKAVELDPSSAHAQAVLGYAAWRTKRIALAESAFEAAVRCSLRDSFFLAESAWFLANERSPKQAEKAAQSAVDANRSSSIAWAALGLSQFRMNDRTTAEASLRRALELNPNDIYAQSAMAVLLEERGENAGAMELADSLAEHAGAGELAESLRAEAKRRELSAMLLERNIDPDATADEKHYRYWIAILAFTVLLGAVLYYFSPDRPLLPILSVLVPLMLIWMFVRFWK